jgi:ferrous iron transport protein A
MLSTIDTMVVMQLSFKRKRVGSKSARPPTKLVELREGEEGIIDRLDLPEEIATRLMELGFLPGTTVRAAHSAPGGDPRVFRVDGSEIALRKETAAHLYLRR